MSKRPKHPKCTNDDMCKVIRVRFNTLKVKEVKKKNLISTLYIEQKHFLIQNLLKSEEARCGPKHKCYIAKPCNSASDCSPEYECLYPYQIMVRKALARRQRIQRSQNGLPQMRNGRNMRLRGRQATRLGEMESGIK